VIVPVLTIMRQALTGISVLGAGEPIKADDGVYVLAQLNRILDDWNAEAQASVAGVITEFTTTPALNPHTIGPTGVWVLAVRPPRIDGLAYEASSGVWVPIRVHDDAAWYLTQSVSDPGSLTDAYYAPSLPNGALYFTGLPASATDVRVLTDTITSAVLSTQSLTLAPGYPSALELTLMEAIADAFHATLTPRQIQRAGAARARIFRNNTRTRALTATGQGVPSVSRGTYDYLTGSWA
jgi:hypothetical protein